MKASSSSHKAAVSFHFLEGCSLTLSQRKKLKEFIAGLFIKEKTALIALRYIFCSDDYLLNINRKYLRHNYYTDIITFDLSEPFQPINAEVYISVERLRDNAREYKASLTNELHRVMFHGALHLCGYKDKSLTEKKIMRKMEDKYLKIYAKTRH